MRKLLPQQEIDFYGFWKEKKAMKAHKDFRYMGKRH